MAILTEKFTRTSLLYVKCSIQGKLWAIKPPTVSNPGIFQFSDCWYSGSLKELQFLHTKEKYSSSSTEVMCKVVVSDWLDPKADQMLMPQPPLSGPYGTIVLPESSQVAETWSFSNTSSPDHIPLELNWGQNLSHLPVDLTFRNQKHCHHAQRNIPCNQIIQS